DGRAALRVLAGGHLALGLVVHQHAGASGQAAGDELPAVDLELAAAADAHAALGAPAVAPDQSVADALLRRPARAEAGLGEDLVQALVELAGGGGLAALEGQFAAGLFGHCGSCSDEAVSASSSIASVPWAPPSVAGRGPRGDRPPSSSKASCGSS